MTLDVAEFAQTVDDAVVRVDSDRLIIRTTGAANIIDIRVDSGYLQINNNALDELALQLDPNQYSSIVLLSGGEDRLRTWGSGLVAQMHPNRLWVQADFAPFGGDILERIQIHGTNFDHLEVNEDNLNDAGPYLLTSNNRVRMHGSAGVDRLNMSSDSSFAIATSVSMAGDGYTYSSNAFGDLYVTGGGGDDFASLVGTRGFTEDGFFVPLEADGNDIYEGNDNSSRIRNDFWDARFVDFETQRVDLLSGDDRSVVSDTGAAWYRVDGADLVGGFRRMINVETIEINSSSTANYTLLEPQDDSGVFVRDPGQWSWSSSPSFTLDPDMSNFPEQIRPEYFDWTFARFDRLVG